MKFLVIQQKMIGDVLASTVICEGLKHYFPKCRVYFVANENTIPVLQNNPFIDKIILFDNEYSRSKWAFYKFLQSIGKTEYYAVIDAYGKLESNLISLFANSKFKIAHYKNYTRWIYTHTVKENLNPDGLIPLAIQNRLALLSPLLEQENNFLTAPKIFLKENEIQDAKQSLDGLREYHDQKFIMIGILGSSTLKTYPPNYMAELLNFVCDSTQATLLFNYIPSQKKEAKAIYDKCIERTKSRIAFDFYAPSLREFIALLSQCSALIGNEGGAVNMAKALGVPTFCIFSPFIIKGAWHSGSSQNHIGIHLADYRPELLENKNKEAIKKNMDELYSTFEPHFFKAQLDSFLKRNGQ